MFPVRVSNSVLWVSQNTVNGINYPYLITKYRLTPVILRIWLISFNMFPWYRFSSEAEEIFASKCVGKEISLKKKVKLFCASICIWSRQVLYCVDNFWKNKDLKASNKKQATSGLYTISAHSLMGKKYWFCQLNILCEFYLVMVVNWNCNVNV